MCIHTHTHTHTHTHILCQIPDQDLLKRRVGQKVDPLSNELFIKSLYEPKSHTEGKKGGEGKEGEEEEEGEEGGEEEGEEEGEGSKENKDDEFQDDLVSVNDVHTYTQFQCSTFILSHLPPALRESWRTLTTLLQT